MIGLILTLCVSTFNQAEMDRLAAKAVRDNPSSRITIIFRESSDKACKGV